MDGLPALSAKVWTFFFVGGANFSFMADFRQRVKMLVRKICFQCSAKGSFQVVFIRLEDSNMN